MSSNRKAGPDEPSRRTPSRRTPGGWRQALPFVVAGALVAFVLSRLQMDTFLRELSRVSPAAFFGLCVTFTAALLSADSLASVVLYRWLIAPVRFRDFLLLRGASYLPSLLNHHLGQAFLTYFLSRAYGVKLVRVAGATLLAYVSWAACIVVAGSTALAIDGKPLWLAVVGGGGIAYLVLVRVRPRWLTERSLLAPLFEVGVVGHLAAVAARMPHFLVLFAGNWAVFALFGVRIPLGAAAVYLPILMVVTTLPITPQGIGTRDAFSSLVFAQFATGATEADRLGQIGAATMSWGVGLTLVEAAVGVVMMRLATRRFRELERSPASPSVS